MPAPTLVIVNPHSRGGATGRRWKALEPRVREALGELEVEPTRAPQDAERIAREGVRAGVGRLVVAGGDGTLSEVVTGLMRAGLGDDAEVGVLPLGTGGDFARTLGVPKDLDGALACIAAGRTRRLDVGRVFYRDDGGREASSYFANVTSLGISALTVQLASRATRAFGGRGAFLIGTLQSLARYRSRPVTIRVDGEVLHEGPLILAAAGNGRFFGGGMEVAPEASPEDGLLDVVVIPDLGRARLLLRLPSLYRGTHLAVPGVRWTRGRRVEAEAEPGTVRLEVDGEPLGTLPARIEVVPGALSLLGPAR